MMTALRSLMLVLAAAPVALPGLARAEFAPPEGCELTMTVQLRGCTVVNHYTCSGDPAGDQRAAYADRDGVYHLNHIDAETRWLDTRSPALGEVTRLVEDAPDHASLTALLTEGRDDYDFTTRDNNGRLSRYRGFDELTGESVVIDGVPLEVTRFDLTRLTSEGDIIYRRSGQQYVSRTMRLFFGGTEVISRSGEEDINGDERPMRFAFPGDPGFAASEPEYDCDALLAALSGAGEGA